MIQVIFFYLILVEIKSVQSKITDEQYAGLPPVFELDNFDNCLLLGKDALYCTIEFKLRPTDSKNPSDSWKQIKELSENRKNYRHDILRHGICLPFTCPNSTRYPSDSAHFKDDLAACYSKKYEHMGLYGQIQYMHCQTNEAKPYDTYDQAVILFLLVYSTFIIFASFYEGLARYKSKSEYEQITGTLNGKLISCFSIPKNFYRLKSQNDTSDTESLKCLQGLRFYAMILVIMSHCIMVAMIGPISQTKIAENFTGEFVYVFVASGWHMVQSFFVISAWLLTYLVFIAFERKKRVDFKTLFWIFVNRYIRLTPVLALVLALHCTLLGHAPKGPFWDHIAGEDYRNCRKNAWTNLLYVNNYINPSEMCLQQTWYVATDTQLFLLALFIIAAMKRFQDKIKWILGFSLVVGVSIPGILAFLNNYDILMRPYPEYMYRTLLNLEDWHVLYSAGYSNIGAYIIGIIFGYLHYNYRNVNLFTRKIAVVPFYILPYTLCLGVILIAIPMYDPSFTYSNIQSAIYWSSGKNLFSLGLAIAIFGMTRNIGWFPFWLCRWNAVQVFGRLTYCAYLIHTFFLRMGSSSVRYPRYINLYQVFVDTMSNVAVSFLFAFFLCLGFELPMTALQKLWIPQKSVKPKKLPQIRIYPTEFNEKEDQV